MKGLAFLLFCERSVAGLGRSRQIIKIINIYIIKYHFFFMKKQYNKYNPSVLQSILELRCSAKRNESSKQYEVQHKTEKV